MNRRDGGSNTNLRSKISFKSFYSALLSVLDWIRKAIRQRDPELPQHELQIDSNERSNDPRNQPTKPLYLLLCHSDSIYATKLLQLSVCGLKSDKRLFKVLQKNYKDLCGKWWSFLSLRTLTGIKFVEFELYKSQLVDIRQKPAIPPKALVGCEYDYKPVPPDLVPPVGENHLMHLFQHPQHADDDPICLGRFPKKLREMLVVCDSQYTSKGWGLQFEEGWNSKKTWIVGFVLFVLGSLLWGILWAVFENSIQDAFTVSSYIVSFMVVTMGFTQAIVGNLK